MPNHVKNKITGPVDLIAKLVGKHDDKEIADFGRIIPMPEIISRESVPSHVTDAAKRALGLECPQIGPPRPPAEYSDADFNQLIQYMQAYRQCGGLMNWYDWSIEMWGTKWPAYEFNRISETEITFETAWSAPHPVLERLAEQTNYGFRHAWADEDTGNNVGAREYAPDGTYTERELSGTREGYELAFQFRPDNAERYKLVDGKYEYIEE
jgi:hypothetical protein